MAQIVTSTVAIGGMTCHSCVSLIQAGIGELDGVESVIVSLEEEKATIVYDTAKANVDQFRETVEDMGFICFEADCKFVQRMAGALIKIIAFEAIHVQ